MNDNNLPGQNNNFGLPPLTTPPPTNGVPQPAPVSTAPAANPFGPPSPGPVVPPSDPSPVLNPVSPPTPVANPAPSTNPLPVTEPIFDSSLTPDDDLSSLPSSPVSPAPAPTGPRFVGGVLVDDTPLPTETTPKEDLAPLQPKKKSLGKNKTALIVLIAILALVALGGAYFYFFQNSQNEINRLQLEKDALSQQVTALNRRLEQADIEVQVAADQPLYADPAGVFSLYRRFTGLNTTEENGVLRGDYGTASDGFNFTATSAPLNGRVLTDVIDAQMAATSAGVLAYDKRSETLGSYPGFSYVLQAGNEQTIHYFFTMNDQSTSYFEFVYTIKAANDEAFAKSESLITRILGSVKLYQ